jgi:hypothetical protein
LLRLKEPMPVIQYSDIPQWLDEHPKGHVISIDASPNPAIKGLALKTDYVQHYREDWLIVRSKPRFENLP